MTVVSGQVLEISLLPETKQASVLLPDEKSVNIAPPFPPLPFTDTEQTGIYTLIQKNETQQENAFAVNAKTEGESDLMQKYQTEQQQKEHTKKVIKTGRSIQTFVIIALLLLLLLEWKVNCDEH